MSVDTPLDRRQFLRRAPLLAAATTAVAEARPSRAQTAPTLNDATAVKLAPVRLGFIGVGIHGSLLMEAASGIAGVLGGVPGGG